MPEIDTLLVLPPVLSARANEHLRHFGLAVALIPSRAHSPGPHSVPHLLRRFFALELVAVQGTLCDHEDLASTK